jgi:hypothetical protein
MTNDEKEEKVVKRPPLNWEVDIIFTDEESRIALKVNKAESDKRTFFSIEVGKLLEDGRFVRFFNPWIQNANYQVSATFPSFAILERLRENAQLHVETILQRNNDRVLAEKQRREEQDVARQKPKLSPGLGKLGKLDAFKKGLKQAAKDIEGK